MIFSSMTFMFIFLPLVVFLYYIPLEKMQHKNILLLLASLIFYAIGEPVYIIVMLFSIAFNFRFGLMIDKAKTPKDRKVALIYSLIYNFAVLFLFKYENFLVTNFNDIFELTLESKELVLPIGISFYTFQSVSYVIDVYRKDVKVQDNILDLGLYIAFFPQLIAGPIVRYSTIQNQIKYRKSNVDKFADGIKIFIAGVGKKMILANNFAVVAEYAFVTDVEELSIAMAWLGAICYSFQILFDFSGYSDMAIGLAKMFGFDFEKNFNYPYISKSVSEFWRRWHISLGSWFRDYVYFPLGGSRVKKKSRLIFNLFVVWVLTGIWHGAAWQFVAWGLMYFVIIAFEKLTGYPNKFKSKLAKSIYQIATMLSVLFGWVIFGENGLKHALAHIMAMFGLHNNPLIDPMAKFHFGETMILLVFAILLSTPIFKIIDEKITFKTSKKPVIATVYSCVKTLFAILILSVSVSYLAIGAHNPFIYFDF